MYSTGAAMLEALQEAGVEYLFANLGSDHPALIEAIARGAGRAAAQCRKSSPAPNEMVALSAAHGFAQITGRAQAVWSTSSAARSRSPARIHNAAKGACRF